MVGNGGSLAISANPGYYCRVNWKARDSRFRDVRLHPDPLCWAHSRIAPPPYRDYRRLHFRVPIAQTDALIFTAGVTCEMAETVSQTSIFSLGTAITIHDATRMITTARQQENLNTRPRWISLSEFSVGVPSSL